MKAVLGSHRRPRRVGLPSFPPLQGILDPGPTVSAIPQTWPARNSPHGLRKYFIPTTFETLLSYPIGFSVDINYLGGPAGIKYLVSFFFMLLGAMCDTCHVLAGYKILGLFFFAKTSRHTKRASVRRGKIHAFEIFLLFSAISLAGPHKIFYTPLWDLGLESKMCPKSCPNGPKSLSKPTKNDERR